MCYELYLSTGSSEDLDKYNSEFVRFERPEHWDDKIAKVLQYPQKWFVGSKSGCSCTFRHLLEGDLGFDEPQDWMPEEQDAVKATAQLYRVIASVVQGGDKVDCLDVWSGIEPTQIKTISVRLSLVPEKAFRLFENYHFVFEP